MIEEIFLFLDWVKVMGVVGDEKFSDILEIFQKLFSPKNNHPGFRRESVGNPNGSDIQSEPWQDYTMLGFQSKFDLIRI